MISFGLCQLQIINNYTHHFVQIKEELYVALASAVSIFSRLYCYVWSAIGIILLYDRLSQQQLSFLLLMTRDHSVWTPDLMSPTFCLSSVVTATEITVLPAQS